ncbi:hypothetical protein BZA70DRAFT_272159 [Myxozyma melibiosi]|uniref:Smr domain-containing protein n=1 Tax=Myxozyma melibiosi TaxID=54550 RepID=A0ABR1FD46_9ASCO
MSASGAVLSSSHFKPQRDYNHADDQEYKRLRGLAEAEFKARSRCYDDSHKAYAEGDGAAAKQLSEMAKDHDRKMDEYNAEAAAFVFRANNADSDYDEIDLHGLYVKEAEEVLEQRISACKARNDDHLEVIVGKGKHSTGGVAKIKPAVEQLCEKHGFQYAVDDDNEGVIVINFRSSGGNMPMSSMPHQPKKRYDTQKPNASYQPGYGKHNQPQYNNNHNNGTYAGAAYGNGPNVGHPQQQFQVDQNQNQYHQQQQQQTQQDSTADIIGLLFRCLKQCLSK